MSHARDYYTILGVKRDATPEEIRQAYRSLARTYHPDVNKSPEAASKFAEATEAYEVLSSEEKRRAYDRFGRAGVGARPGAGAGGPWAGAGGTADVRDFDLEGMFDQMFGRRGGSPFGAGYGTGFGAQAAPPRSPPQRGEDQHHRVTVSFMTAVRGGTEHVRLQRDGRAQEIDVKIPAGIDPRARLRLKGRGDPGRFGGPAGDLIITVEVGGHPYFRRDGLDLAVDVPVTIAEAALGTTVQVPLLTGSVELKVPPGTSSGRKLRVKGKGITDGKGRTGDFFAVVQIVVPEKLSEHGRDLLRELAPELKDPRETEPWV